MRHCFFAYLLVGFLSAVPSSVWGYDIDLGPLGHACDTCGGGVIGGLPGVGPILKQGTDEVAGDALQQWIVNSRNSAIGAASPVPPNMRQLLTGYIPNKYLNWARYKIGDNGVLNLGGLTVKYGDADAITLEELIIFRNAAAANNPSIWAHELTHVQQYDEMGVHAFAVRYVRNYHDIEDHAYAVGNGYWNWRASHPIMPVSNGQVVVPPPPPPPQLGAFCYTPLGRFGPGPLRPFGAPCAANTIRGMIAGRIGP